MTGQPPDAGAAPSGPGDAAPPRRPVGRAAGRLPPGPRLPRAVQALLMLRAWHPYLASCQRRYGDCFTIRATGLGTVVYVCDPQLIEQVFLGDPAVFRAGQLNAGFGLATAFGPHAVAVLDGAEHRRMRRSMSPSFQARAVRRYGQVIADATEEEVRRWPVGEPFPLHPRMRAITFEVIMRTVIGPAHPERAAGLHRVLAELCEADLLVLVRPGLQRFWPWRRYRRLMQEADELLLAEIAERRSDPGLSSRTDILSLLVRGGAGAGAAGDPAGAGASGERAAGDEAGDAVDGGLRDDELRDQMMNLLIAGHETTSTALAWAFERALRHPAVLDRLRGAIQADDDAYLDAFVREILRVRPVLFSAGRALAETVQLGGYQLPAGTYVLAAIDLVQHSADWYDDPGAFQPERFLGTPPAPYTWIPFGGGARRCLGASLAVFEIKTVMRSVLSSVDLAAVSPSAEPIRMRNITLIPGHGAQAVVRRRLDADGPAASQGPGHGTRTMTCPDLRPESMPVSPEG
jgi:cytochrome P450 family 135